MERKFDDKTPIYLQIMNFIKRDIVTGRLKEGDKLPSVREMSSELRVNPNTVQRVYQELERENLTYTQRGTGNFVKGDKEIIMDLKKDMARQSINAFINDMKNLGFSSNEIVGVVLQELEGEGENSANSIKNR